MRILLVLSRTKLVLTLKTSSTRFIVLCIDKANHLIPRKNVTMYFQTLVKINECIKIKIQEKCKSKYK